MINIITVCLLIVAVVAVYAEDHVHYKFEYGVHDPHTQDHKSHYEYRDGDYVVGGYTMKEADGTLRVVKYKSGPKTGFEAVVERIGHADHHGHGGHDGTSHGGTTHWSNQGNDGSHAH